MDVRLLRADRRRPFHADRPGTLRHPVGHGRINRSDPGMAALLEMRRQRRVAQVAKLELAGLCSVADRGPVGLPEDTGNLSLKHRFASHGTFCDTRHRPHLRRG